MATVAMDESGNTQKIIGVGLVSIPDDQIPVINSVLSLSKADPEEIRILYSERSGGEFKYTDMRNAFRQTRLPVYDEFLRKKLEQISRLRITAYASIFPNPQDNDERLRRLVHEAQDLLQKWAHQNQAEALSKDLKIIVDQQVFPEAYVFQYFMRRNRANCSLIPKRAIDEGKTEKVYTDMENSVKIQDANSKTFKSIQLTDILIGCVRERHALNVTDYLAVIERLFPKEHTRIQIDGYEEKPRGYIKPRELKTW
ncbi:MAG: DUF3800 domain-containing protein [Candidatus Micrarchaeota archaeon]